ncbi:hypothetical protein FE257_010731 [Aspergillus nanangensis]|uniref:Major facilitator superfamily (MFS) profile domain-containing protein n=1 Tax=Aspergillus nanangensis TaxID=2582783 RepID=A0AAD4CVD1_ASPNN|nr:hypothetical protein FE257_010731 [Aspergillus nanangensis]
MIPEPKDATHLDDGNVSMQEKQSVPTLELQNLNDDDIKKERRLTRRIDLRLLPILSALYTMCLIDRTNIGAARISGIDQDLELTVGSRVSIALLVFYIGYVIMELPSNILIKKLGAANWLSGLGLCWGVVTLAIGFSKNWITLTVLRVLLGICEAGVFPGCVYLVSSWYRVREIQKRLAVLFLSASFISSFSNILAYGFIHISAHPFTAGWRWIFIVEGAITSAIGLFSWFVIVDFPGSPRNTFLSAEEKATVESRLVQERGTSEGEKVTWKVIRETVTDWRVWSLSFMYNTGSVGIYAFLFFLPIILQDSLGFSQQLAFLLSAPPAAFAVIFAFVVSYFADRMRLRGPFMFLAAVVGIVGLCMIGFLQNPVPRYIGAFLGQAGTNALVVTGLAWGQNNDAPDYVPGIIATMVMFLATAILAPVTSFFMRRSNQKADAGLITIEGAVGFRYTW